MQYKPTRPDAFVIDSTKYKNPTEELVKRIAFGWELGAFREVKEYKIPID